MVFSLLLQLIYLLLPVMAINYNETNKINNFNTVLQLYNPSDGSKEGQTP